ncbi:MAG: hypothetical protein ACI8U3_000618 [Brevundimonas sp.]|jgi:hypothetical protein
MDEGSGAVLGHKNQSWPAPPLFEADWREPSGRLGDDLSQRLAVSRTLMPHLAFGGRMARIRMTALPFWPGWTAGEALITGAGEDDRVMAFLYGPFGAELLDGRSDLIHDINERRGIQLDTDARRQAYLRFFTSAVRGDEGAFFLVESDARLAELTGKKPRGAARGLGHPIRSRPAEDDRSLHEAVVLYGAALFRSTFSILPGGMVMMEDDQIVTDEHPGPGFTFDGAFRRPTPAKGDAR